MTHEMVKRSVLFCIQGLYKEMGITSDSKWGDFELRLRRNEKFLAVEDEGIRKRTFEELVDKCRDALADQRLKEHQEQEFRVLLQGQDWYIKGFSKMKVAVHCAAWISGRFTFNTKQNSH